MGKGGGEGPPLDSLQVRVSNLESGFLSWASQSWTVRECYVGVQQGAVPLSLHHLVQAQDGCLCLGNTGCFVSAPEE